VSKEKEKFWPYGGHLSSSTSSDVPCVIIAAYLPDQRALKAHGHSIRPWAPDSKLEETHVPSDKAHVGSLHFGFGATDLFCRGWRRSVPFRVLPTAAAEAPLCSEAGVLALDWEGEVWHIMLSQAIRAAWLPALWNCVYEHQLVTGTGRSSDKFAFYPSSASDAINAMQSIYCILLES
jgi:hypothetical protein